jgi:hypothetical protein
VARTLLVEVAPSCDPGRFVRLGAGLLDAVATDPRPRLLIAGLEGQAILLGRHQRARSALEVGAVEVAHGPVLRRVGGGRALAAGAGRIGLYRALPRLDALLDAPIPADRVLNRYVRGLLAGLTRSGAGSGAHYFGRDFVSSESRQLARVSQDGRQEGPTLFEAFVAVEESLDLPAPLRGYPVHSDPRADGPPPVILSELWSRDHTFDSIAEAIVEGYASVFGCRIERVESLELGEGEVTPDVWEEEEGWEESGVADIPIGFAEALLRHGDGKVQEVRFRGDFVAPAFVLRDLEASLVGTPLEFSALGAKVDAAFRRQGAAIMGMRGLRTFPDAILAAAGLLG